jgi:hypothetical protein
MADAAPADPNQVRPAPIPTSFAVVTVTSAAGDKMVLLQVQTPAGAAFYFLEPASAVQVGNALRAEGKAGLAPAPLLVKPTNGLVVPGWSS